MSEAVQRNRRLRFEEGWKTDSISQDRRSGKKMKRAWSFSSQRS